MCRSYNFASVLVSTLCEDGIRDGMNGFGYLFLFVLGIAIMHFGSAYLNVENMNDDDYPLSLTVIFSGIVLSVMSMLKVWKIANDEGFKKGNKENEKA